MLWGKEKTSEGKEGKRKRKRPKIQKNRERARTRTFSSLLTTAATCMLSLLELSDPLPPAPPAELLREPRCGRMELSLKEKEEEAEEEEGEDLLFFESEILIAVSLEESFDARLVPSVALILCEGRLSFSCRACFACVGFR